MSETADARRIDRELLAWLLALGLVGVACEMASWFSSSLALEGETTWAFRRHFIRETATVVVAVPMGVLAGRSTGLFPNDVARCIAHEPGAVRFALRRMLVGAAVGLGMAVAMFLIWRALEPEGMNLWNFLYASTPFQNSISSLGVGIHEEVVWRVGCLSFVAWLASKVTGRRLPLVSLFVGLVVSSLAFGANHPIGAWLDYGRAPDADLYGTWYVLLASWPQVCAGFLLGLLYWRVGLLAAVSAHVTVDFVMLVVVPFVFPPSPL